MRKLIIVGTGGHALVVAELAYSAGYEVLAFADQGNAKQEFCSLPVIGIESALERYSKCAFTIAIGENFTREKVSKQIAPERFPVLCHKNSVVASSANLDAGTVVMAGAHIGPKAQLGKGCLVNTSAIVEHECHLESYASLAPRAVMGGNSRLGARSALSLGAAVKHGVRVGSDTVIGLNAGVLSDIPSHVVAYGTPARVVRQREWNTPYLA